MNLRRIVGALGVWVGVCLSANAMAQSSWHRLAQQWTLNDAHEVAVAISGGWVPVGSGSEGDFGQYRGAVVEARPHGEGELKLFSGEWFKGQFVNGWPHGRGRARCESCGEYSGDWQYGLPHGEGQSEDAVGNRYRGQWHGVLVTHDGDSADQSAHHRAPDRRRAPHVHRILEHRRDLPTDGPGTTGTHDHHRLTGTIRLRSAGQEPLCSGRAGTRRQHPPHHQRRRARPEGRRRCT